MKITFVMGIPCSGKSTYIKNNFSDRKVIDLYDYQKNEKFTTIETIKESYEKCKNALIDAIKNNEDVVMEHTLLRAIRRKVYIDAVKSITECPIEIVVINPDIKILKQRAEKRDIYNDDEYIKEMQNTLEIPTKEEGFSNIKIIE